MTVNLIRSKIVCLLDDPAHVGVSAHPDPLLYIEDGALLLENGHIAAVGPFADIAANQDGVPIIDRRDRVMVPGFVDTHVHFPQTDMIGSYGEQLLDWLATYTFPTEAGFADPVVARDTASFFLDTLLANGTTTALVYGSVHREATDILFQEAHKRRMRLAAGKAMMDRNVPETVRDTAESSDRENRALIKDWHGKDRLSYAITPRFAPACTSDQMHRAGRLLAEIPDLLMQTHMSENKDEIAWVMSLFPDSSGYLDVYRRHGLLTGRSIFAHAIHLDNSDYRLLSDADASVAHCPSSNLFLGSGLFDYHQMHEVGAGIGIGTDVGAGTSFSMLATLGDAYKVSQLRGHPVDPWQGLYAATLGGARTLKMDDRIGSFEVGKEADFIFLDPKATPLMARRTAKARGLGDLLFAMMVLGDDRSIAETWVNGQAVYRR